MDTNILINIGNIISDIRDSIRRLTKRLSTLEANSGGYKVYTALLNQFDTDDPHAVVLGTNTIGDIAWTRSSAGVYIGTLTGAFPENKTWCSITSGSNDGNGIGQENLTRVTDNTVVISLYNFLGAGVDFGSPVYENSVEIRVYP